MEYLLAGLPILAIIVLLVFRLPTFVVVLGAIGITFALGHYFPIEWGPAVEAASSLWEVTLTIAVLMFAGIALASFQNVSGSQESLSGWLNALVSTPARAALLYGAVVVPLVESLIGWGIGIVIGVPLLLGAGLPKVKAIQISLLGHMMCPWGSFAPSLLLITEVTGFDFAHLGTVSAVADLPVIFVLVFANVLVQGGLTQLKAGWREALVVFATMGGVLIVVNMFITPALGGVLATLAGGTVIVLFARSGEKGVTALPSLALRGVLPYGLVLVALMIVTLLRALFGAEAIAEIWTNPALWLMLGVLLAPWLLRMHWRTALHCIGSSLRAWVPAFGITLLFILFGVLLAVNGMSATLAEGALLLGAGFTLLVPALGFITGFVTGSNTAGGAMFSEPLKAASLQTGVDPVKVVALHTVATGAAVMCAPSRAVLAIQTANLVDSRRTDDEPPISVLQAMLPGIYANGAMVALLTAAAWLFV